MRKTFVIIALAALGGFSATAQKGKITESEVSRIVKTLSADEMQGRGTFTPGIEKASSFIQTEFKKIGLKPLPGAQDFNQAFSVFKVTLGTQQVTVNGASLSPESVFASSTQPTLNWASGAGAAPQIIKIAASDNFVQVAPRYLEQKANTLVLVDPAHANIFKRYRAYVNRGGIKTAKTETSVVFLLTPDNAEITTYNIALTNTIAEQKLNNVAGMLPGRSKKNEYVIFSGHYDHLGITKAVNGDSIANGADDDATGTTAVITLAKYFKKRKNERSIIFVAFTAEEIGGYGSQYFSKQVDPNQVVAMFNIEMIGKESQFGKNGGFITGFERSDLGKIVQKNLEGTGFTFHPDPYIKENLFYRSDNATLARLGVPAHSLSTDKIDTDKLYHSVDDEFESLDIPNMTATIKAIAKGAESIIAGKDTPSRVTLEK